MKFRSDDFPSSKDLTDTVTEEHPKHMIAVAEQRIMAMHSHDDGSAVELHEIGSKEFIQQSIQSSIEGKLGSSDTEWQQPKQGENNLAAAKIEYEKKSSQNQPMQLYGSQQSVTGGISHNQETVMMGCNCGAEWTVTGQSTKANDPSNPAGGVKIEQYGRGGAGGADQPGGYRASGVGGEKQEYRTSAGQQQDYKG
ncbi:hypothetical protein HYU20_04195 [Candidatus Woesearchaeota archaeon]|nr:hypothetical protein [Candidatus Woesearchaeota archaeon]